MIKTNKQSDWISFTDLMTVLMVIFMFISVSYIVVVNKRQDEINDIINDYEKSKVSLYKSLKNEFQNDLEKWQVKLNEDLSIQFINPDILFNSGSFKLKNEFKKTLSDFLPRYFKVLTSESYINRISEIRIEGHTDNIPALNFDRDTYIGNVKLSQARATEVLKFLKSLSFYKKHSVSTKEKLDFLITANGLSYGRMLDSESQFIINSRKNPNKILSRRVEFRIVPKANETIQKLSNKIND